MSVCVCLCLCVFACACIFFSQIYTKERYSEDRFFVPVFCVYLQVPYDVYVDNIIVKDVVQEVKIERIIFEEVEVPVDRCMYVYAWV